VVSVLEDLLEHLLVAPDEFFLLGEIVEEAEEGAQIKLIFISLLECSFIRCDSWWKFHEFIC
jgi:hypothetical protein